jgi:hypothetical protein
MYVYWFGVYGWILLCVEELEFDLRDIHRGTTSCLYIFRDLGCPVCQQMTPHRSPLERRGMSVGQPMGLEFSPCSHHQEGSVTLSSGSKEPCCHLGWTQASDPMQKLRHPGRILAES